MNLMARSFTDINKITLAEIRSLATSAYNTAQQRRNFQSPHATSAIMGKKPATARRGNNEKKKSNTTHNRDKDRKDQGPRCRICQAANKVEYHWHADCPHQSSSASTSKKKNVTFEEVEEDE